MKATFNEQTGQIENGVQSINEAMQTPWSVGNCRRSDHFSNLLIMNSCACLSNTPHLRGQSKLTF